MIYLKELKLMKDHHYRDIIIFGFVFLGSDEKVAYIMQERGTSYKFWPKKTNKPWVSEGHNINNIGQRSLDSNRDGHCDREGKREHASHFN